MTVEFSKTLRGLAAFAVAAVVFVGCGDEAMSPPAGTGIQPPPAAPGNGASGSPATANPAQPPMAAAGSAAQMPMNTGMGAAGTGASTPMGMNNPTPMGMNNPTSPTTPMGMNNPTPMTPPMGMNNPTMTPPPELPVEMGKPTLFWLDILPNLVTTAAADGSGAKRFHSGSPLSAPDGVTVDPAGGHVFVLNMGSALGGARNGSLVRFKLDGSSPEVIMRPGAMADGQTFDTGKQVTIDKVNKKLYMGDREGSKVWRCDLDGKNLEVLVSGHGIQQVVGVAADPINQKFYFTDRNGRKVFRANMKMPDGQTHANRDDLEMLYFDKASNAMPLDLELDIKAKLVYWTDRDQNKVFSMPFDMPAGSDGMTRTDVKTVASNLTDVIGLAFDHEEQMLYVTHSGSVSKVKTDGTGLMRIGSSGTTGIAFARIP